MNPKTIKEYMIDAKENFIDPLTGELNCTLLAEDACDYFDDYDKTTDPWTVPEIYFEIAFDVDV